MLDLDKLDKQFDDILATFTAEKLQQWIEFADEREEMELLLNGDSVDLDLEKIKPKYLTTSKNKLAFNTFGEINYTLAA